MHWIISSTIRNIGNNKQILIQYTFTIFIYITVFGVAFNTLASFNYFSFLLLGLVVLNTIAICFDFLYDFKNAENNHYIAYYISLPLSHHELLVYFLFEALVQIFLISLLPLCMMFFMYPFIIIIKLSLVEVFFTTLFILLALGTVLYVPIYQLRNITVVMSPLLTRLSSIFYPLLYIPALFLPFALVNPVTWLVESIRSNSVGFTIEVLILVFLLDFFLFFIITRKFDTKYAVEGVI